MFRSAWQDFSNKFHTWCMCDRIRVSPREGKLLRIQAGDLLTIQSVNFEVIDRSIVARDADQLLQLTCRTESGFAILVIEVSQNFVHQSAILTQFGFEQVIDLDEVQIWPRRLKPNFS